MYKKLIAVATGEIKHAGNGLCPDPIEGFDSRDPDCPACKILIEAAAELERRMREAEDKKTAGGGSPLKRLQTLSARVAELESERAERAAQNPVATQAVGYVNALRYIAWTAAGYMDCVHTAKQAIGETGALPPPPNIQPEEAGG